LNHQVTKYICSLRSKSTKCLQARLAIFFSGGKENIALTDLIFRTQSSLCSHHLHRKYKTRQMAGKYFSVEMVEIESTSELGTTV